MQRVVGYSDIDSEVQNLISEDSTSSQSHVLNFLRQELNFSSKKTSIFQLLFEAQLYTALPKNTMASLLPAFFTLAPFHLLAYSTSFTITSLSFRVLSLAQFRTLQKSVFPTCFQTQFFLALSLVETHPLLWHGGRGRNWREWVLLAVVVGTAGLNWGTYGPRTLKAMRDVAHQGNLAFSLQLLVILELLCEAPFLWEARGWKMESRET